MFILYVKLTKECEQDYTTPEERNYELELLVVSSSSRFFMFLKSIE